ncbi:hypothetical protein HBI25_251680 [Parastagonospora nodorum]|nr:hypothetical protein HBI25_251680 [Parastagonospora nodorum]
MTPGRWVPKRTVRGGHESGFARPVGIELHICCSVQPSFKRTARGGHSFGFARPVKQGRL